MMTLPKLAAVAAASATLGLAALAPSPAAAQGWRYDGWHDRGWGGYERPRYGYNNYETDAGEIDIAICPRGYHLGRSGRLCWPD